MSGVKRWEPENTVLGFNMKPAADGSFVLSCDYDRLAAENERLRGLTPEGPPRPYEGYGLPRYGLRWNGPSSPLSVPMEDGYWTPWHLAHAELEALKQHVSDTNVVEQQAARATGLSQGWNLVRQCDGFVIGHSSEEPSWNHKAKALADGRVYVPFLVEQRAEQEPVAWIAKGANGYIVELCLPAPDDELIGLEWKPLSTDQPSVSGLVEALEDLVGAASSVNCSALHIVKGLGDDQPCYWQRKEWVDWLKELGAAGSSALAAHRAKGGS